MSFRPGMGGSSRIILNSELGKPRFKSQYFHLRG